MKKTIALLTIALVFFACSTETANESVNMQFETKAETETLETYEFLVGVSDYYGKPLEGKIIFTIDEPSNTLVRIDIDKNLLDRTDLNTDMLQPIYYSTAEEQHIHQECIDKCNKDFTDPITGKKIRGRGWCKAGCWGKTIVEAIKWIGDIQQNSDPTLVQG